MAKRKSKPKIVWTTTMPTTPYAEEHWYWIRYRGKNGIVICPCSVMTISKAPVGRRRKVTCCHTARNDWFSNENRKWAGMSRAKFGPKIEVPDV